MAPSETAMIAGDFSDSPAETIACKISKLFILKAPTAYRPFFAKLSNSLFVYNFMLLLLSKSISIRKMAERQMFESLRLKAESSK
jgi:hypothetical protein